MVNDFFDLPLNYRMTSDEAETNKKVVASEIEAGRLGKTKGEFMDKLLNYVVRYNNFNFDSDLEQIIPDKYRD